MRLAQFQDSSLNGLQIEGSEKVDNIAVAVDAGLETLRQAIHLKANFVLVHHGLFWGKVIPICKAHKTLVKEALNADISLYAVHLPLDAHQTVGNNFQLGKALALSHLKPCAEYHGQLIGCHGVNDRNLSLSDIADTLCKLPGAGLPPLTLAFGPVIPEKIVIVSGAGAEELTQFEKDDFDTFITGEPRQSAYHFAKENKLNVIFAGHYATETLGVIALGKNLSERFGLNYTFIDIPTGI